jgi:NDP-sugar pyrophosphorylase family protein
MKTTLFPVAILAGGLATRMRPLTESTPKALLEIAGEPFVVHQLRLLAAQGIERVMLCVGYLGERIEAVVGNGASFGLQVRYSYDGPRLLGTAGALKQALTLLDDWASRFFVLYGDSYLPCDFRHVQEAFQRASKLGLMTVFRNAGRWDRSNVLYRHGRIEIYDKSNLTPDMQHIDYGLGILDRRAFNPEPAATAHLAPGARCAVAAGSGLNEEASWSLADLYKDLLARDRLAAHEVFERFYEIGSFTGMEETCQYLRTLALQRKQPA